MSIVTDISIDVETYSEVDIRTQGAAVYAEHPSTELICMRWRIADSPTVKCYIPEEPWGRPAWLDQLNSGKYRLHAWNCGFERGILKHVMGVHPGEFVFWYDTMAIARNMGLPGALGDCGRAMRLGELYEKSSTGTALITYLCIPYKGNRRYDPVRHQKLIDYCGQDVIAESTIASLLPPMTKSEREIWLLDQKINERGVPIDIAGATKAVEAYKTLHEDLREQIIELTGVENPASGPQMAAFFKANGEDVPNLQSATLEKMQRNDEWLSPAVAAVLPLYRDFKRTPMSKYAAMIRRTPKNGRMPGVMLYHAAHTGRWSSVGVNLQNMPRPDRSSIDGEEIQANEIWEHL